MALTQTEVSQLYVTIFGRASEGAGNTYWQTAAADLSDGATQMLDTQAAADYFGSSLDTDQAFIEHIYLNTLGKTYAEDTEGVDYWVAQLAGGMSRGDVVATMVEAVYTYADSTDATTKAAYDQFVNRVAVSDYCADTIDGSGLDASDAAAMAVFSDYITSVTDDAASVEEARADIDSDANPGEIFTLTNDTDIATANIFNAPMVYVPDGSDRILSLQDEDILTGTAGRADNTLNATLGNINADEGTTGVVTPELINIQNINIDWTGTTTTLDLRYSDAVEAIHINKLTADGNAVAVNNITTAAADLRVANAANSTSTATFNYQRGVLSGDETADIELDDVLIATVAQTAVGTTAEGFEVVNLNAVNGVDIQTSFSVNEMEHLIITGSDYLDIVSLTEASGAGPGTATEYYALGAAGIANPSAVGLLELDASEFDGDLTLDITNSLGGFADPSNSGATVHGVVTGGAGDDTFWASANAAATSSTNRDQVDGGVGDDVFATTAGITGNAAFTNIESLELHQQGAAQTVDFDAFDDSLVSVTMRGEAAGAATFNLNDLGAALAEDGLVLQHGITGATAPTVNALLKDASGTDDTIAIDVVNGLNTGTTFDYTLDFDGDNGDGDTVKDDGVVENVTINDLDTESNIVTLNQAQEQTGTLTLTGGTADLTYTVASSLIASTIDASTQLSDLRLTVGDTVGVITDVDQEIMLGSGDDMLTFANIDDFNTDDGITDAGGDDVVRAAFSEDADLTLAEIEGLHIIANDNVDLGMANADVDQLVIMADIAADQAGGATAGELADQAVEPFAIAGVAITDVITLTDTTLSELNFFADLDQDNDNTAANQVLAEAAAAFAGGVGTAAGDAAYKGVISDESTVANFNGITLANNTATDLTVNINSSLDDVIYGATAYNLGQLTAHGVTSMDIQISDEDTTAGAANAVTTINNIYAKNMTALSVTAADDVDLKTVSGAPLNNSLLSIDATNVGGDFDATVISLGNNATVALADGDNTFSALGSAGKDIVITAGDGDNTITGSAQDDEITTGSGRDIIVGDRGDNVMESGAGNDTLSAKDGNDTYDVGSGIDSVQDNVLTGINASLATNTVSMNGGVASVLIDVDGAVGGTDVDQMLAVGAGSDLTISWTGATVLDNSAVLDGALATLVNAAGPAATNGGSSSDLILVAGTGSSLQSTGVAGLTTGVQTVAGGAGNDVVMWTGSAAGDALAFSGGAGNDAAIGTIDEDTFIGGAGADYIVTSDTNALDGIVDVISIADGESTVGAYDVVALFDTVAADVVAVGPGSSTAGADVLDLAAACAVEAVVVAGIDGTNVGDIETHLMAANGLITFGTDDTDATFNDDIVMVGTGANQISLSDALGYLATNTTAGATYMFEYDVDGDGVMTAGTDSVFIFQDGASDTVVELLGLAATATGVEALGAGGADTLINIA